MSTLNLKPTHKSVKDYYAALDQFNRLGVTHETAVRSAFQSLLESCGKQSKLTLVPEHSIKRAGNKRIVVDGALIGDFELAHGYWEAKDIHDDLPREVSRKFEAGYPSNNILFQTPERAILWQNNQLVLDSDLSDPKRLVEVLQTFFSYTEPQIKEWKEAVEEFKDKVPDIGRGLAKLIRKEKSTNRRFIIAFADFLEKCRSSINPNLSEAAVEEMLIQHLLTERIFRTVFNNPDFTRRNVIANEIEKVIDALTSQSFSRRDFLESLNRFYVAIERTAETISDFSQKQHFLNTVYEQFFQGFSVEVADTHGIVYTPQPIVDFMVKSVEQILQTEFGRSLSDSGVHIIDPFVGTGNFIVRVMREIRRTALEEKYQSELHCNEVMLLPYYIASMNIEHEFYEATAGYKSFNGICLVDTFELAEERQLAMFTAENAARVQQQKQTPMFVIIGNPPYNAGQVNENDNNKNRKYEAMDEKVSETYAKDSKATLKRFTQDPYVKAIRWSADRLEAEGEGVIALVTNNGFVHDVSFDGMRKHLADDFDAIYILDLGGNARKGLKVSDSNVFGIRVGVSINLFIKSKRISSDEPRIFYCRTEEEWSKKRKFHFLNDCQNSSKIQWRVIQPDERYTWLTTGLHPEFETFVRMGQRKTKTKNIEAADVIFHSYSLGISTNRDPWVYNFNRETLLKKVKQTVETYNSEADRWKRREDKSTNIDDFVISDDKKIKWSRNLKRELKRGRIAKFAEHKVKNSLYRPFTDSYLFFDQIMNDEVSQFPTIFPTYEREIENRVICVAGIGNRKAFGCLITNKIPSLDLAFEKTQCFPFYIYNEDGTNRRENITDWALSQFQIHYQDDAISKWNIFHYIYALLHHPDYRVRYEMNLKRDLPRLPYTPDFWEFAKAGKRLAKIHVDYEEQPEYRLGIDEKEGAQLNWRVEKMKLYKNKTRIQYNNFLTLDGIPSEVFNYRLGNRSALEWVIDQYRVKTDKRSGIKNNPNREDDPQYIVKLIQKVITVSLETVEIVEGLPDLEIPV